MEKSKRKVFKRVMAWMLSIVMLLSVSQWDMIFVSHAQGENEDLKYYFCVDFGADNLEYDFTKVTLVDKDNESNKAEVDKTDFATSGSSLLVVEFEGDFIDTEKEYKVTVGGFEEYNDYVFEEVIFDKVEGNEGEERNHYVNNSDIVFKKKSYGITINENVTLNKNGTYDITNGSITIDGGNGEDGLFEHGDNLSITVNANEGYYISDINPEANVYDDATSAKFDKENINEDSSLDVEIKKKTYSIKVNGEERTEYGTYEIKEGDTKTGEIKIYNGDNGEKTGKFEHGDKVSITIDAADNYAISEITGSALYINNDNRFDKIEKDDLRVIGKESIELYICGEDGITSDCNDIEIQFAQCNVKCESLGNGIAEVEPNVIPYGGKIKYNITPEVGYMFDNIYEKKNENGVGIGNPISDNNLKEYCYEGDIIVETNEQMNVSAGVDDPLKRYVQFKEIPEFESEINWRDYIKIELETTEEFVINEVNNIVCKVGGTVKFIPIKDNTDFEPDMIRINYCQEKDEQNQDIYQWSNWENDFTIAQSTKIKTILFVDFADNDGRAVYNKIFFGEDDTLRVTIPKDDTKPGVSVSPTSDPNGWSKDDVTVSGNYTINADEITGELIDIDKIIYTTDSSTSDNNKPAVFDTEKKSWELTEIDEQSKQYFIYAIDKAGNVSDSQSVKINIDKTLPKVTDIKLYRIEDNENIEIEKNKPSFGNYANDKVIVHVSAEDVMPTSKPKPDAISGAKSATLVWRDASDNNKENYKAEVTLAPNTDIFEFEIPEKEFADGILYATVTDVAGNSSNTYYLNHGELEPKEKEDVLSDNSKLMIEKRAPKISIKVPTPNYTEGTSKEWYSGDIDYTVELEDLESALKGIGIVLDTYSITDNYEEEDKTTSKATFVVNTDKVQKDGLHKIIVSVEDNAGNDNNAEKEVYIDRTSPKITGFDFDGEVNKNNSASPTEIPVELKSYGYFFEENTVVTVSAGDDEASSGINDIILYKKGINDSEPSVVQSTTGLLKGKKSFTVNAGFKGMIYAEVIDNVGHKSKSTTPSGTILENKDSHDKAEEHIKVEVNTGNKEGAEKHKNTYKDSNKLDLYDDSTWIKITAKDSYAGLKEVEWSVVSDFDTGNNQSGKFEIKLNGNIEGDTEDNFSSVKEENSNLVTEINKWIKVSNNSNDIKVNVKITDNAMNTSETGDDFGDYEVVRFSIDKTKPTVTIDYGNDSDDPDNKDYYKANRKATITVTERNFDKDEFAVEVTNTDGKLPNFKKLNWEPAYNQENPDKSTYTAEITYDADGDYTFEIVECLDRANNSITKKNKKDLYHEFTIDKTVPEVTVTYDNADSLNGNYFKANRTATITINEHNFNSERVVITGTTKGQSNATFPVLNGWTSNGDVHTTTIDFTDNALYSFDIDFMDMAGNESADYSVDEFYVDKTEPEIIFENVADKTPYNDEIAPIVKFTDENFDPAEVSVSIRGLNYNKIIDVPDPKSIANGQEFAFANFEKKQSMDDIYMLEAEMMDKAGNKLEKSIMFSVNRFGSVYMIDEQVEEIKGKYVQSERDIVFSEYNVNRLKHDSILVKLTKNGTPTDLVENQDYVVEKDETDEGEWSVYKYTVNKSLFQTDGMYSIAVYSVDEAGNVNENINEKKRAEIEFGIDKTMPVVVPLDVESGKQYAVDSKSVTISVKDNLVLDNVEIFLNNERIEYTNEGENYTFDVASKSSKQDIKVMAYDAAGNICELAVENFLVTTNVFIRWFNNTPLFVGSIVGVALLGTALASYLLFFRKGLRKVTNK